MPINLICVGKNKNDASKSIIEDYLLRIRPYTNVVLTILPDVALKNTNNPQVVIKKEADVLIKHLNNLKKSNGKTPYIIVLDREGSSMDSVNFSEMIDRKMQDTELTFIIGGVYGIGEDVKKVAAMMLSLSKMTFTHQMSRIIILEQIYRSLTIINNKKYHY